MRTAADRSALAFAALVLAALALKPPPARAFHAPATGPDSVCSACHSLDAGEGDQLTSYINSTARTFQLNKLYNGGTTPAYLGCTFCHYLNDNAEMKPVLRTWTAGR